MKSDVGATPLARTLFDLASEHDSIDEVTEDLEVVQKTLDYHLRLKDTLRNSQISGDSKRTMLAEIFQNKVSGVSLSFLRLLAEVGTVSMLPAINKEFSKLAADSRKRVLADVTTAVALNEIEEENVRRQVVQLTGKEVRIRHQVDPSIIGGVIVKLEGEVFDASVSHQLDSLRSRLGGVRK